MKRFLVLLLVWITAFTLWAQREQDFASRYMALYASGTSLSCTTVSPLMMERMLRLPSVEDNEQTKKVLQQLKSIRMVEHADASEAAHLYNLATKLAKRNSARYKLRAEDHNRLLYTRKRGRVVVEMVLMMKRNGHFCLVDLTGNMSDSFMEQILKL